MTTSSSINTSVVKDLTFLRKEILFFYDINKIYEDNFSVDSSDFTLEQNTEYHWMKTDFLRFSLNSLLGVSAKPLLNTDWVLLLSRWGFDNFYYDRSKLCHITVDSDNPEFLDDSRRGDSFGVLFREPEFIAHYVKVTMQVSRAGIPIPEVNFSCPNIGSCQGEAYTDENFVFKIIGDINHNIKSARLILVTLGMFSNGSSLRNLFPAIACAEGSGIRGINTIERIIDDADCAFLGSNRVISGICDGVVRKHVLDSNRKSISVNEKDTSELWILSTEKIK